jgi:hypothetical protein
MPSAPSITSITFDKPGGYLAGDKITVTVAYVAGGSPTTQTLTGVATDSTTGLAGSLQVHFTVSTGDVTTVTVSDTGNHVWTPVSDSGSAAVFTTTA